MLKLRLKKTDNFLSYGIPMWGKIPFLIFFGILVWGLFLETGNLSIASVILLVLSSIGIFYRENWIFDNNQKTVTSVWGIGPFVKKTVTPYGNINRLDISHFIRGKQENQTEGTTVKPNKRGKKAMIVFAVICAEEEVHQIEIIEERKSGGRTEMAAQSIAAWTGLPLTVDRDRDMGTNYSLRDIKKGPGF